jgi:hypothetical protein
MSHFWKFYTQEIRGIGARYLIFIIAYFAFNGISYFMYAEKDESKVVFTSLVMLGIIFIAPPVLLALSFRKENEYLSFSLPISRTTIFFSRYLASLTILAAAFISSVLWSIFVMVPLDLHKAELFWIKAGRVDFSRMIPYYNDSWGYLINVSNYFISTKAFLLYSFVILGIISLTRSFHYIFRWLSEFLCNFSALMLFIAIWFGLQYLGMREIEGQESRTIILISGILFFAMGLFLFEKYGEI